LRLLDDAASGPELRNAPRVALLHARVSGTLAKPRLYRDVQDIFLPGLAVQNAFLAIRL